MTLMSGEPEAPASVEGYLALGAALSEVARRVGIPPEAIEEKAALEARRAAEVVTIDGAPVSSTEFETRWIKGKMETPGVQQWEYRYRLQLGVGPAYAQDVFAQVRAYWIGRGFTIDHWDPADGVSADPGKGSWGLAARLLDETMVLVSVESGVVQTSSNPLGDE